LKNADIWADSCACGYDISNVKTDGYDAYYTPEKGRNTAEITVRWNETVSIGNIVIKENIRSSQRVESFILEARIDGVFKEIYSGTVIGYKRIIPLKSLNTDRIRIKITDSRTEPAISFVGIYKAISKGEM